MSDISVTRLRKQLYCFERTIRALRAELENEIISTKPIELDVERFVDVDAAMTKLLSAANPIPPITPSPYEQFFPGVSCSYSVKGIGTPVTVRGLSFEAATPDDPAVGSTCFVAEASFDAVNVPDWLSVETVVDANALVQGKSLTVKLVSCFRHSLGLPLPNFRMLLRLFQLNTEPKDYYCKTFPSLSSPFEFTYSIEKTQFLELPVKDVENAKLLIFLPVASGISYEFILSHFAASSLRC
jgi:hypothetical protein